MINTGIKTNCLELSNILSDILCNLEKAKTVINDICDSPNDSQNETRFHIVLDYVARGINVTTNGLNVSEDMLNNIKMI